MRGCLTTLVTLLTHIVTATNGTETSSFVYILSVDLGWPDASWPDAEQRCKDHGWYLARILSTRDMTWFSWLACCVSAFSFSICVK